jgi:hypothetical protein
MRESTYVRRSIPAAKITVQMVFQVLKKRVAIGHVRYVVLLGFRGHLDLGHYWPNGGFRG